MNDMTEALKRWQMDEKGVRERVYRAPTPRERERWHALWLLARGWTATEVAEALGRDAHTIGNWCENFERSGPSGLASEQSGGPPPPSTQRNKPS
jgi:transposase